MINNEDIEDSSPGLVAPGRGRLFYLTIYIYNHMMYVSAFVGDKIPSYALWSCRRGMSVVVCHL